MPFFNISDISEKEVVSGYHGRGIHTGSMSFMFWSVDEGAVMPLHSHHHEQVAHIIKGMFELTVDGETALLRPGQIAVIPPHVLHGGKAITSCELLDVFNPEREEYKF